MGKYVVYISDFYVRDMQINVGSGYQDYDNWVDCNECLFVGVYVGETEDEVIETASNSTGYPKNILSVVSI